MHVFCSPAITSVVAAYVHLPSYLQEPEGTEEEVLLSLAGHAGETRGSPPAAASHTLCFTVVFKEAIIYVKIQLSGQNKIYIKKKTKQKNLKPALPNSGDLYNPLMCAERGKPRKMSPICTDQSAVNHKRDRTLKIIPGKNRLRSTFDIEVSNREGGRLNGEQV